MCMFLSLIFCSLSLSPTRTHFLSLAFPIYLSIIVSTYLSTYIYVYLSSLFPSPTTNYPNLFQPMQYVYMYLTIVGNENFWMISSIQCSTFNGGKLNFFDIYILKIFGIFLGTFKGTFGSTNPLLGKCLSFLCTVNQLGSSWIIELINSISWMD